MALKQKFVALSKHRRFRAIVGASAATLAMAAPAFATASGTPAITDASAQVDSITGVLNTATSSTYNVVIAVLAVSVLTIVAGFVLRHIRVHGK